MRREREGDWYHLFRYRRLTKERLEGCATPTMEVSFGPFHDERIVFSSCQTPCTRSGARENQLMKHSMREAGPGNNFPHGSFCEYHFLLLPSFPSPTFPFSQVPTPKKEGRERAELSNSIFRPFQFAPTTTKGRQTGEREAKFVRMALAAVSAASNQSGRGWMDGCGRA